MFIIQSKLTLDLARQTEWTTTGAQVAKRVYNYFQSNKESLMGKTIFFYDTAEDKNLPFAPTATLKDVLSDNNFFDVFYEGNIKAIYGGATNDKNKVMIKSRQFLGY